MSESEGRRTRFWRRREVIVAGGVGVGLTLLGCTSRFPRDGEPLRPPSAAPEADFLARCIKCQRCLTACPLSAIRLARWTDDLRAARTPILDFHQGWCNFCMRCTEVCPTGALTPTNRPLWYQSLEPLGRAKLTEHCIALKAGGCSRCYEVCPYQAIVLKADHVPDITSDCTGCGRCVLECPSNVFQSFVGSDVRGIEVRSIHQEEPQ